jgi:hypothetical protein
MAEHTYPVADCRERHTDEVKGVEPLESRHVGREREGLVVLVRVDEVDEA